jgi:hypothetical protein
MDLYRYFHPHHNPRLRHTPLRLQELGELEQAARELFRAVRRARIRTGETDSELGLVCSLMETLVCRLQTLREAHPGDTTAEILQIAHEREETSGWEQWAMLVTERLTALEPVEPPIIKR